jgi:hypothetical protein
LLAFQLSRTNTDYHIKSSNHVFGSSFRVHYSLFVTTSHTLSLVALDHRLTSHTAPPAFYTVAYCLLSVAWVNSGVACYVTVGSAAMSPRWRGGAECWLAHYRSSGSSCYVTAGGGGGGLHSANTSQYIHICYLPIYLHHHQRVADDASRFISVPCFMNAQLTNFWYNKLH